VIILSPLKQYAEQNLKRFNDHDNSYKSLLIDSDGTRDIDKLNRFATQNCKEKMLFSATYKSVDIISEFIHSFSEKHTLVIIDELLKTDFKILFMSATPAYL